MTNIQNLNNTQLEEEFALINPQQELTESEKNIIKQLPEVIFAINDYFTSLNNLHLKKAEELFAEFGKNDLSIEANPNLNEDIAQEISSNTQRLANSFKSSIEVGKKMEVEKNQNLGLVQRIQQLEEVNRHKEMIIRQLEQQLGEQSEISKWDNIKTNMEKEENINNLAKGGCWDKQIQTLQNDKLPANKQQIVLQMHRRNHYRQLENQLSNLQTQNTQEQQAQIIQSNN